MEIKLLELFHYLEKNAYDLDSLNLDSKVSYAFSGDATHFEQNNIQIPYHSLLGSEGALPEHYTHAFLSQSHRKQRQLLDFYTLFNTPLLKMIYESWSSQEHSIQIERNERKGPSSQNGFLGIDTFKNTFEEDLSYYSALFLFRLRSEAALRCLISPYFQLPCRTIIRNTLLVQLQAPYACQLSIKSHFNRLGKNSLLGNKILSLTPKLIIVLGPLDYKRYHTLLNTEGYLQEIFNLIQSYTEDEYLFQLRFLIKWTEGPCSFLEENEGPRLGWDAWLYAPSSAKNNSSYCIDISFIKTSTPLKN